MFRPGAAGEPAAPTSALLDGFLGFAALVAQLVEPDNLGAPHQSEQQSEGASTQEHALGP